MSVALYLNYGLVFLLRNRFAAMHYLEEKMRRIFSLKWGYILTFINQNYLDIAVGSMLSF